MYCCVVECCVFVEARSTPCVGSLSTLRHYPPSCLLVLGEFVIALLIRVVLTRTAHRIVRIDHTRTAPV
jgi:hypothetical protein